MNIFSTWLQGSELPVGCQLFFVGLIFSVMDERKILMCLFSHLYLPELLAFFFFFNLFIFIFGCVGSLLLCAGFL